MPSLVYNDGRFELLDYDKLVPGFSKDEDTGVIYTVDAQLAKALLHYAARDTELEIYKQEAELKAAILQSRKLDSDIIVPAPYGLSYDPYQKAAIEFGIQRRHVLLGDEQRLGKTIEALGIVNWSLARKEYQAPRGLIICQGHLVDNWKRELGRWLIQEHGIANATSKWWPMYSQWVVMHYELLDDWAEEVRMMTWPYLIIDEVHKLKNPKANRTMYVYGNGKEIDYIPAERIIAISGTPIPNRPIELFGTINYLDKERWPSRHVFGVKYCAGKKNERRRKNKDTGKEEIVTRWDYKGASNLPELQAKLRSTIMIRRTFDEVYPQMPPKRRYILEIPPGEQDLEWIREELEAWNSYQSKLDEAKEKAKKAKELGNDEAFMLAMQDVKYTLKVRFEKISAFRHRTALAKLPFILTHVEEILNEGGKLVVFAHHHDIIEALIKKFTNCARNYGGKLMERTALEEQDRFQGGDPTANLFVCALTMCEGLHLAASHHELFAELDWVPSNILQAESRCRGRETKNPVLIQFAVLQHSLDALMGHKVVSKLDIQQQALDRKEQWVDPDPIIL